MSNQNQHVKFSWLALAGLSSIPFLLLTACGGGSSPTASVPDSTIAAVEAESSLGLPGSLAGEENALIITGVFDGPLSGGLPKAIELYAVADIPDLGIYGVGSANNGGGTDGEEFTLSGSATAGDFIYVATEADGFEEYFGSFPDFTDGSAPNINGDDAIELFTNGAVTDVFGDIDVDGTGQPWDHVDGWTYRNNGTGPDGSTFVLENWSFSGTDAVDNCTTNATCGSQFPIGTYVGGITPTPTPSPTSDPTPTPTPGGDAFIHEIQGNSSTQGAGGQHDDVSPLDGETVTVEGVVIADFQGETGVNDDQLDGFFLQEEDSDADADLSTSEGLFVFCSSCPTNVDEGDLVQVTGDVSEFFGMTQIVATGAGNITVVNSDDNLGLVSPITLTLPVVGDIDDYYEQYEGMLTQFDTPLFVSEYFELARYGQVVLTEGGRSFQYTHLDNTPSSGEFATFLDDLARRQIILDDDDNIQNSPLPDGVIFHPQPDGFSIGSQGSDFFRGGDQISQLVGVLHWSFAGQSGTDAWRIRPTVADPISFAATNTRPTFAPDPGGNITVGSFNVLNYFDGNGSFPTARGADSSDEFERQNQKLIPAIQGLDADVLGLIEIENNNGGALNELVSRLDAALGVDTYEAINTGTLGTDEITVAFIYKPGVIQPQGSFAVLDDPAFTDPNNTGEARNRPALAQTFEVVSGPDTGEVFTVVVNHFKSKRDSGCSGLDCDQGDGQAAFNSTRTGAANFLVNTWIPSDPTGQGDPDFLIIGDLNAYKGEDPITAIKDAGYTDLIETFSGNDAYSFVFDSQLGYLDHALANSPMLSQVTGTVEWHINADEVNVFDYNNTIEDGDEPFFEAKPSGNELFEPNAFRTSDHDPLLVGLDLESESTGEIEVIASGIGPTVGVTINADGNYVISNTAGRNLRIVDSTSLAVSDLGTLIGLRPGDVDVVNPDGNPNFYAVVDALASRIRLITPGGLVFRSLATGTDVGPTDLGGLAIDGDNVIVADKANGGIQVISINGTVGVFVPDLGIPMDIAVINTGEYYVTDKNGRLLNVVLPDTVSEIPVQGSLGAPKGLALSGDSVIIVDSGTETGDGRLLKVDPLTGAIEVLAAAGTIGDPTAVAVDRSGPEDRFIVTDLANGGRLLRIQPE